MQLLSEETAVEFVKGNVIVKAFMDDCSKCAEYEPVFAAAEPLFPDYQFGAINIPKSGSKFKSAHLPDAKEAPQTLLFKDGVLVRKQAGKMSAEELAGFINEGALPKAAKQQELYKLFAEKGELTYNLEKFSMRLNEINMKIEGLLK